VSLYGPGTLREANGRSPIPTLLKAGQSIDTGRGTQSPRSVTPLDTQARIAWQRG
jgi:hypothetical protein